MNLNTWKQNINIKYGAATKGLKRIRKEELYKSTQYLIDYYTTKGNQSIVCQLNEFLHDHYGIYDYHILIQDLHTERINWLKEYTNSERVINNEYYRQLAFKCIHENYAGYEIQELIKEGIECCK